MYKLENDNLRLCYHYSFSNSDLLIDHIFISHQNESIFERDVYFFKSSFSYSGPKIISSCLPELNILENTLFIKGDRPEKDNLNLLPMGLTIDLTTMSSFRLSILEALRQC